MSECKDRDAHVAAREKPQPSWKEKPQVERVADALASKLHWMDDRERAVELAHCAIAAAREDTERPDRQDHRLDRISFFSGYYSAANTLLYETIKPSNDPAVKDFAERAWKATGADGVRDTEQEHEL